MYSTHSDERTLFADQFAPRFKADERSIELSFPDPDEGGPPPGSTIAQRVEVSEALSSPFKITVHAVADRYWDYACEDKRSREEKVIHRNTLAHPERFLGQRARVIVRAEGQERRFDGIVTATRQLGQWCFNDEYLEGFQLLELTIEPGLALLAYRRTCRIFHDMTPMQVLRDVLQEHQVFNHRVGRSLHAWQGVLAGGHHSRSYLTQYQESDLDFLQRLIADAGRHYLLPLDEAQDFGHGLLLIPPEHHIGAEPVLTLWGDGSRVDGLPLRQWHAHRCLGIPRTRLSSPNYKKFGNGGMVNANGRDLHDFEGAAGEWGEYLPLSPHRRAFDTDNVETRRATRLDEEAAWRQMVHDEATEGYLGETIAPLPLAGVVRVGDLPYLQHTRFKKTTNNAYTSEHNYVIVAQTLVAHAPLHPELHRWLAADLDALDRRAGLDVFGRHDTDAPPTLARFQARPIDQPLAPDPRRLARKAPGALTGRVIGFRGATSQTVSTDASGRIGVKLDWQQPEDYRSLQRQPQYADGEPITWLRYVQPGASHGFGFQYLPREGDEVLVLFLNDDPDRPVAVGSLYGPHHPPPAFGGVGNGLPENRALTGLRTKEHREGNGSNELCMDDSTGEVGLRLGSSTAETTLTLGHIATPRTRGKATHRGTGAELRTEGAAAVRAAQGLLLSTHAAAKAAAQLHHDDLTDLLLRCQELTRALSEAIGRAGGTQATLDGQAALKDALSTWSQPAAATDSGTAPSPVLAIHAKEGIVAATPASQVVFAGQHIDVAADGNVHLASGERTHVSAAQGVTIHARQGGVDIGADHGPVRLNAHQADALIDAREAIRLTSHDGDIVLSARNIRLVAEDGSFLCLGSGIELGTSQSFRIYAEAPRYEAPKTMSREVAERPAENTRQRVQLRYHDIDRTRQPAAIDRPYGATLPDGSSIDQRTGTDGMTEWLKASTADTAFVRLHRDDGMPADADGGGAAA